ncbi:MAG: bifunctional UDP-N-acetylglucosamine diphosphorylase/glucosamine-1-phosphate N-acetyltransferase GlmU [Desulfomonile sp.]|nr:bifunctional UDP-N-acetylglucosamine diphosphorylase/glucosamine-1-phosphate N-acetyltransferase GlmU [Desulfomonile sp.]
MSKSSAIILAAGKGTRMKSALCKVLHPIAGRPMILYVIDALASSGIDRIIVVVGHQADEVKSCAGDSAVEFVVQEPQLGTGHAVAMARRVLEKFGGSILVVPGDVPLIEAEMIQRFRSFHEGRGSRLSVMTCTFDDPSGYGRVVRNDAGEVLRIVEERDASPDEKEIREVNTGIYCVESALLFSLLERVSAENAQGEYYLTDIVEEAVETQVRVHGFSADDPDQVIGINTRADLARANRIVWGKIRESLMLNGVTMLDPSTVYVDHGVRVGPDTVIHPSVTLCGDTRIGGSCTIEPGVLIKDSVIGEGVKVMLGSRMDSASVGNGATIGPMAHLRPEARIGRNARIGNFVEVKKTDFGDNSKAAHLTYLGDAAVGEDVNIGCGTITCNYDGKKKHRTIIGDRCFIGSDVQFVAPVEIGEGSLIGAGSTITKDVPPRSLAVARGKQKNYPLRKGQLPERSGEDRKS